MLHIVGNYYETPSGRIMVQEALPVVKFITKDEYNKHVQGMMSKHVIAHGLRNLIDNKMIVVYYIKRRA